MYIVTRTFRDANGVFKVGSIVEPTGVKAFRSRLQQRHIVDVDEQNIEEWAEYFKNRHGVDLTGTLKAYINDGSITHEPVLIESVANEKVITEDKSSESDGVHAESKDAAW